MKKFNPSNFLQFCKELELKTLSKYDFMQRRNISVYNIICTFDTETTSTYVKKEKFAFVYEWSFCIAQNEKYYTCYGRTLEEFIQLMQTLVQFFKLSQNKKIIVWVHNLPFDFQFIRKLTTFQVFATDERKPIIAQTKYFIFRDSLILSAMSLEKTAQNLTSHEIKKLKGDLDYSLIRTYKTTLSQQELKYCENDVLILAMYIQEQIDLYDGKITKIPLTNTGRVREYVRNACLYTNKNHDKSSTGKYKRYVALMKNLTLDLPRYMICKSAFMGGFTHANCYNVGKVFENVQSIDFTSSYPTVICSERFPMSPMLERKITSKEHFFKLLRDANTLSIFLITFHNLKQSFPYESYISVSKCIKSENVLENNGRVVNADFVTLAITNIDYEIIEKVYGFSSITIHQFFYFYAQYLPTPIIQCTLDLYNKKTTLKNVEGKETEYLVSKGMLNSIYGMMVTAIVRDEYTYNEDWSKEKGDAETQIEQYNKSAKRFLFYPWGIFVTAYARRNLWKGILHMQDDYLYSDTDSIKFLNYEKHKNWIEKYNKEITEKIFDMCQYKKIDFALTHPRTIKGKEKPLGVWDYEGYYDKFKTLGAKRYMIEKNGEIEITIAGLGKKTGAKFIASHKNPFNYFNNAMTIPKNKTGKMTHTYIDERKVAKIKDYQGHFAIVDSPSSIHLEPCEFTLDMSKQFLDFLESILKGEQIFRF